MNADKEHRITIRIADIEPFKLPVNENVDRLRFGANADSDGVALAKVTLYYATMLYRRTNLMNNQAELLREFEARLDSLLEST